MNFQKIVLTIAIIILIVMLVVIGITLSKSSSSEVWPPIVGQCPDYWVDLSGNGEACLNSHNLGKCNLPTPDNKSTMNFNQAPFIGDSGTCAKYKWATNCQVTWDGITSGVKNPCDTSTSTT
jgi:hypothetical protein